MNEIIHKPNLGILDRDLSIAESGKVISEFSPYLEDLCNFASNALVRCQLSLKDTEGTPASLIYLYYHVIQMVDGIQVLCARACFSAAIPLLRSLLEASLSIDFIIADDYKSRSAAWLVSHYLGKLRYLESIFGQDGTTPKIDILKLEDKFHKETEFTEPDPKMVEKRIKHYRDLLSKPKFIDVATQLQKGKGIRKWFSLNKGPTNIEQLARELNRPLHYEILYRRYSEFSHAQDASRIIEADENKLFFVQMRSANDANEVLALSSGLFLIATRQFLEKFRYEEKTDELLRKIVRRHRIKNHK